MKVKKRDGSMMELDLTQIRKQTIPACSGLPSTSYEELELATKLSLVDGMSTSTIQELLISTALNMIDIDTSNYTYVAARLKLYDLYHKIKRLYHNKKISGDVYKVVTLLDYIKMGAKHDAFSDWIYKYSEDEVMELNNCINSSLDNIYTYPGVVAMVDLYLGRIGNDIFELPQHMHMAVAMFLAQNEKDNVYWAKKFYEIFSKLKFINATPINSNGRFRGGSTISCLVTTTPDDLTGIFDKYKEVAKGSAQGSGWGWDWSNVRSLGASINRRVNAAGGKIPFLKIANGISIAVDQLGLRPGAFAVYINVWDIEVYDFIDLKKKSGEERRRALDLFPALKLDDVFLSRVEKGINNYTLFDPYDVPDLNECYGDEFKKRYEAYEEEFRQNPDKFNPNTIVVDPTDIMRYLVISYFNEGMPFIFFKDNVNRLNPFKELGIIRSSNLCQEILQNTEYDKTVVCNLGSINLARIESLEELERVAKLGLRALDNSIDLTEYPSKFAKDTQLDRRTTGIGIVGEAEDIANKGIIYGSDKHAAYIRETYSIIKQATEDATEELANEKGACPACKRLGKNRRNTYMRAIAPNSTSGLFAGTSNSCEAVYNISWIEEMQNGSYKITAPNLNLDNINYYKNSYNIGNKTLIDMTSIRQEYIDQGISHNLYFMPDGLKASEIKEIILYAWKKGLKTLYYLRSKPPKNDTIKDTKITCIGCSN